ncbi:HGGxSTG domain-containing protein [Burkholderia ubonensis]|nr:HGGxSTG domain-containing protein [Burkholderia ubonensis]
MEGNGRCKLHGGRSTGSRTIEGEARAARNGLRPKQKRTP